MSLVKGCKPNDLTVWTELLEKYDPNIIGSPIVFIMWKNWKKMSKKIAIIFCFFMKKKIDKNNA